MTVAKNSITVDVSIAINGYKNPELLRQCLTSVQDKMRGARVSYELLVCDSATEDTTHILMNQEFPEVRFFPFRENVGFKRLINTSLLEARGKYVFCINSDVLLTAGSVDKMFEYMEVHPEIGVLGPAQKHYNEQPQQTAFRFYTPLTIVLRRTPLGETEFGKRHLRWFLMQDKDLTQVTEVDWVMGSALFVNRDVALEKVGLMDENLFMYMEDVDWCRRFWEVGLKVVYYPPATIYHFHAKGSAKGGTVLGIFTNRLVRWHLQSAVYYFRKYWNKSNPHQE